MANITLKPKNGTIKLDFMLKYKGKPINQSINQPDDRRKDDKHKKESKESVHGNE